MWPILVTNAIVFQDRKHKYKRDINVFGWRNKNWDIKINLFMKLFLSEFLSFQNIKDKRTCPDYLILFDSKTITKHYPRIHLVVNEACSFSWVSRFESWDQCSKEFIKLFLNAREHPRRKFNLNWHASCSKNTPHRRTKKIMLQIWTDPQYRLVNLRSQKWSLEPLDTIAYMISEVSINLSGGL